jgi:hypothetical protein
MCPVYNAHSIHVAGRFGDDVGNGLEVHPNT